MSKLLDIEEQEKDLPILCIVSSETSLVEAYIKDCANKFRIIIVDEKKPSFLEHLPKIYFISLKDIVLLPKLQETIDYALIFLKEIEQARLSPVIEKLTNDKTQVLFAVDVFSLDLNINLVKEYRSLQSARFAILGEIISRKKIEQRGELSKIIENIIINRKIDLDENNDKSVFPITLKDAVDGISRLLLGNFYNDTFYYLFYKHPETVLACAHLIARIDPDVKITFSEKRSTPSIISRKKIKETIKEKLGMLDSYIDSFFEGFEKGMVGFFENQDIAEEYKVNVTLHKIRKTKKRNKISTALSFAFASLFYGTVLFAFINLLFLGFGILYLKLSVEDLTKNNLKSASYNSQVSKSMLSIIKPSIVLSLDAIALFDPKHRIEQGYLLATRVVELTEIAGKTIPKIFKSGLTEKNLSSTFSDLSFIFSEAQRVALDSNNQSLTKQLKYTYSKLLSFSDIISTITGFGSEKKYLLLFQNNNELRPTGGFIGSVGDLNVADGKIDKLSIQDVYDVDGQLKTHIDPPFIVRRYLQPHLYLRDSNFFLNFQETASTAAYLYNLETGKKPDAVIAINLEVLKKVLKVTGPIELTDYNITVNADNVSSFLQNTIKDNFFPGSTGKKDVLNKVLNRLIAKASQNQKLYIDLLKLLPDFLEQKDILISFSDNSIQKIFSVNNYAGEYIKTIQTDPKTINDYLYINEANIGINKVNQNVNREISYEAMIGQGNLGSKTVLTLNNNSNTDDYKSYINFVIPKGSVVKQIIINGTKQTMTAAITDPKVFEDKNFKAPNGLEVEQYLKNDLMNIAFVATVPKNKMSSIEVDYQNGAAKSLSTIANYSLVYIKQPGVAPYKLSTTLYYPDGYSPADSKADSYGKNFAHNENTIEKDFSTNLKLEKSQSK